MRAAAVVGLALSALLIGCASPEDRHQAAIDRAIDRHRAAIIEAARRDNLTRDELNKILTGPGPVSYKPLAEGEYEQPVPGAEGTPPDQYGKAGQAIDLTVAQIHSEVARTPGGVLGMSDDELKGLVTNTGAQMQKAERTSTDAGTNAVAKTREQVFEEARAGNWTQEQLDAKLEELGLEEGEKTRAELFQKAKDGGWTQAELDEKLAEFGLEKTSVGGWKALSRGGIDLLPTSYEDMKALVESNRDTAVQFAVEYDNSRSGIDALLESMGHDPLSDEEWTKAQTAETRRDAAIRTGLELNMSRREIHLDLESRGYDALSDEEWQKATAPDTGGALAESRGNTTCSELSSEFAYLADQAAEVKKRQAADAIAIVGGVTSVAASLAGALPFWFLPGHDPESASERIHAAAVEGKIEGLGRVAKRNGCVEVVAAIKARSDALFRGLVPKKGPR